MKPPEINAVLMQWQGELYKSVIQIIWSERHL
jgi:hypothetical protein